jgi:hypothetical protein
MYGHSWAPTLKIFIDNQQPMLDNRHATLSNQLEGVIALADDLQLTSAFFFLNQH